MSGIWNIPMTQSESHMNNIKKSYNNRYKMDLKDTIVESVAIGDFTDLLIALTVKSDIVLDQIREIFLITDILLYPSWI